jgi:signal transduction histidine kinase
VTEPGVSPFLSDTPAPDSGPASPGADDVIASELGSRLQWLVRLRWGAALALALGSVLGRVIGAPWLWPSLFLLGVAVALYNAACALCVKRFRDGSRPALRAVAVAQIALDLAALLIAVHYTGGLTSPLVAFFGFHMVIGTIVLATETMYLVAGLTSLGALALQLMYAGALADRHALDRAVALEPHDTSAIALLALVGFLFGVVYLTGSVSDRLKQRNDELRRTSDALQQRSIELQQLLAEVAELERRKSHYMRISAHQLRSPLGTVRTSLDVLAGGYVDLASPRAHRLIRGAAQRVGGLLDTVNGLLDLAKVREGRQRAPWAPHVNLNQLVTDLNDALAPFAEERGVRVVVDLTAPAVLDWGVPPDLVHAVENLIHNAIKYSFPDGEVNVKLGVEDGFAVLRVVDHGIGVPKEFRDQLFLEFVRAPNARAHAPEGTGLGLALVREVALAHGGRVTLESPQAGGSTFRLHLPLHMPAPDAASAVTRR